jgi:hypothetical protein
MKILKILLIAACFSAFSSCYYDKEEELYPNSFGRCDTTNSTYSVRVRKILDANCMGSACHDGATPSGWDLSTYAGVSAATVRGNLTGAINQVSGFSAMPKNRPKLSDCDIAIIQNWVSNGAKNN